GRGARARRRVAGAPRRPASGLLAAGAGRGALGGGGPLGRGALARGLLALLALELAHPLAQRVDLVARRDADRLQLGLDLRLYHRLEPFAVLVRQRQRGFWGF